ncbi:hypothetical protein [Microcystis sp. LE19-55.1A]|jgi:hypothetical protein|uniref:hypothetical protein n=1 Tax=Microcystis sp. LE19-55.1A TaxID=3016436 RepID=UPI0022C55894|nr:hypothetical protein [Microcystis sp. LE19-55.1A]MCZ8201697.1 hypothetical protein [Microcystis sp. LE19-55.1A]
MEDLSNKRYFWIRMGPELADYLIEHCKEDWLERDFKTFNIEGWFKMLEKANENFKTKNSPDMPLPEDKSC